eukprot:6491007-Amphidinium_carterae.3
MTPVRFTKTSSCVKTGGTLGARSIPCSLVVPMRAPKKDVPEVFQFLLASDTYFTHSKGFVGPNFVPDPSKGSIESCAGALNFLIGVLFEVPHILAAKAGFQTRKVRSLAHNIPVGILSSEDLFATLPSLLMGKPSNPVSQSFQVPDWSTSPSFVERGFPHALVKGPNKSSCIQFSLPDPASVQITVTWGPPAGPPYAISSSGLDLLKLAPSPRAFLALTRTSFMRATSIPQTSAPYRPALYRDLTILAFMVAGISPNF